MTTIREFEKKLIELHPEQQMRSLQHYYIGQEAIASGIISQLSKKDKVLCSYRSHGHYLAKGGNLNKLMCELYLKRNGLHGGKGGSMHLADQSIGFMGSYVIVGSYVAIATGLALSIKIKKENSVVVAFFGDGALDEGILYEAFNFAALKKLPIIFVCENNGFASLSKNTERQSASNHINKSKSFNIKSFKTDGQNVFKVFKVFNKALKICKSGKGPVFLDIKTFRFKSHIGTGDDIGVGLRSKSELENQKRRDPLKIFKKYLKNKKNLKKNFNKIDKSIFKKINLAVRLAKKSKLPKKTDLLKGLYA